MTSPRLNRSECPDSHRKVLVTANLTVYGTGIRLIRSSDDSGDTMGHDNILFAAPAAVPEPASIGLIGGGLAT